jgi:pimeloyl-ACP methyl ester carboxylesterase
MDRATVNGVRLDYQVTGSGDPILLVGNGPIADSFAPLESETALTEEWRLIRYRQRGQSDEGRHAAMVTFEEHAADADALLQHLDAPGAHVVGHSTGAAIALELALLRPDAVRSLVLLEPPLPSAPGAADFFARAEPSIAACAAGDRAGAMAEFLSLASGLEWERCRAVIDRGVPGGVERAIAYAPVFFESYLPALSRWRFGADQAAGIGLPVLSVTGARTDRFFAEGHDLLRSWLPRFEETTIADAGHLLHLEQPAAVAGRIAQFLSAQTAARR